MSLVLGTIHNFICSASAIEEKIKDKYTPSHLLTAILYLRVLHLSVIHFIPKSP